MGGMMRKMVVRAIGFIDITNIGSRFIAIAKNRIVPLGFAIVFVPEGIMHRLPGQLFLQVRKYLDWLS